MSASALPMSTELSVLKPATTEYDSYVQSMSKVYAMANAVPCGATGAFYPSGTLLYTDFIGEGDDVDPTEEDDDEDGDPDVINVTYVGSGDKCTEHLAVHLSTVSSCKTATKPIMPCPTGATAEASRPASTRTRIPTVNEDFANHAALTSVINGQEDGLTPEGAAGHLSTGGEIVTEVLTSVAEAADAQEHEEEDDEEELEELNGRANADAADGMVADEAAGGDDDEWTPDTESDITDGDRDDWLAAQASEAEKEAAESGRSTEEVMQNICDKIDDDDTREIMQHQIDEYSTNEDFVLFDKNAAEAVLMLTDGEVAGGDDDESREHLGPDDESREHLDPDDESREHLDLDDESRDARQEQIDTAEQEEARYTYLEGSMAEEVDADTATVQAAMQNNAARALIDIFAQVIKAGPTETRAIRAEIKAKSTEYLEKLFLECINAGFASAAGGPVLTPKAKFSTAHIASGKLPGDRMVRLNEEFAAFATFCDNVDATFSMLFEGVSEAAFKAIKNDEASADYKIMRDSRMGKTTPCPELALQKADAKKRGARLDTVAALSNNVTKYFGKYLKTIDDRKQAMAIAFQRKKAMSAASLGNLDALQPAAAAFGTIAVAAKDPPATESKVGTSAASPIDLDPKPKPKRHIIGDPKEFLKRQKTENKPTQPPIKKPAASCDHFA
jgi:hypothetical protein